MNQEKAPTPEGVTKVITKGVDRDGNPTTSVTVGLNVLKLDTRPGPSSDRK